MLKSFKTSFIVMSLAIGLAVAQSESPWRFEAGASVGNPTPLALVAGVGYKAAILHIEGFGMHRDANDFWCGIRGNLGATLFRDLPFSMDLGVGGGYEYAEAPNKMHQALNKANGGTYVYPYNFIETLDVSAEVWIHLYGLFTQIVYPLHYFKEHDAPDFIHWRVGFLTHF